MCRQPKGEYTWGHRSRRCQLMSKGRDLTYEALQVRRLQLEAEADPGWYARQAESIENRAQVLRLRQEFYRVVRAACATYAGSGWRPLTGGMATCSGDGHLLHIEFIPNPHCFPLQLWLHARATSPYLYSVATGKPLTRIPPAQARAVGCVTPVWLDVRYAEDEPSPEGAAPEPSAEPDNLVRLTPGSVRKWLDAKLVSMTATLTELGTDRGMRDWLLADLPEDTIADQRLRMACLLTKHLGESDRLPQLLQAAEEAWERSLIALPGRQNTAPGRWDRQRKHPSLWSHQRWLKHFNAAPLRGR